MAEWNRVSVIGQPMSKWIVWIRLCSVLSVVGPAAVQAAIIDWEGFPVGQGALVATANDNGPLVEDGASFNRTWNAQFDCCPGGWAASAERDQSSPGLGSAYAAVAKSTQGGGYQSRSFGVANNLIRGEATIDFAEPVAPQHASITNVTYSHLAVVNGDDGAGFVKGPFGAGDWFLLEVIGMDAGGLETGRVPFYLADYRTSPARIVDDWTQVDLTGLGSGVARIEFEMSSTDVGMFGMNTPAYFAMDNLTFAVVPEPSGTLVLVLAFLALGTESRRTRNGR